MAQYKKNATKLTEFQLHEGWIEISKNEKRTMKESLQRCIDDGYTRDVSRAQGILDRQFQDDDSDNDPVPNSNKSSALRIASQETPFEYNMYKFYNKPLPMEFLKQKQGKAKMDKKNCRALKSKINLKFQMQDSDPVKYKPAIKQSIIDDFEKAYKITSNQDYQRMRHRKVSPDNMFDDKNIQPIENLRPDSRVQQKINRIDINKIPKYSKAMAGVYTEIGQDILDKGHRGAKLICTGNWKYGLENANKARMSDTSFFKPTMEKVTDVNVQDMRMVDNKMIPFVNNGINFRKKRQSHFATSNVKTSRFPDLNMSQENIRVISPMQGLLSMPRMDKLDKTDNSFVFSSRSFLNKTNNYVERDASPYHIKMSPQRHNIIERYKSRRTQKHSQRNSTQRNSIYGNIIDEKIKNRLGVSQNAYE